MKYITIVRNNYSQLALQEHLRATAYSEEYKFKSEVIKLKDIKWLK